MFVHDNQIPQGQVSSVSQLSMHSNRIRDKSSLHFSLWVNNFKLCLGRGFGGAEGSCHCTFNHMSRLFQFVISASVPYPFTEAKIPQGRGL